MRYREGDSPLTSAHGVSDEWLLVTVVLSILIGAFLVWWGARGRQWWLVTWCAGLIVVSIAYLVWPDWPH